MSGLQVTVETLSPIVRRLDVKVPAERVASVTERLYRQLGQSVKLKGFRPGHVPRSVLVKHFGDRIGGDVARALVDETFPEALGTTTLAPVATPVVEPSEVRAGEAFFNFCCVVFRGATTDFGVGSSSKSTGQLPSNVEFDIGIAEEKSLCVGVHRDVFHAFDFCVDHSIDSIDTTATHADDFNDGEIIVACGCHGFLQRSGST